MTAGDNAYQFGSSFDYEACYTPTWGRDRPDLYERTKPALGNHEYMSAGSGYYLYFFGLQSPPPPPGYYAYDLGTWRVLVLDSTPQVYMCYPPELTELEHEAEDQSWWQTLWSAPQLEREPRSRIAGRACAGDVPQQAWLVTELSSRSDKCTLVYFHHPRFSSGSHGSHFQMQRIWDILYTYGVDVVVAAHDHNYERFAPQDLNGKYDPTFGIRQFVVGTGGGDLRSVGHPIKNSEVLFTGIHGVIGLALNEGRYGWAFIAVDGTVKDSGSGSCHDAPTLKKLPAGLPT
ncbi:MAG: metallophosphoesterase [Gemmatimonadota bacterium]|nr:metallophosphoesterase [Gemmatimonadota bacterium]